MLDAAIEALAAVTSVEHFVWVVIGVLIGLTVGLLPGLGGTVGMSILVPFVFGMDPFQAIAMLIGMAAVTSTSDTFPGVLLGVPGSSGAQAVIMDGYPMARQGKGGVALGAAFMASLIGGLLGAAFLLASISVARPIVLALASPELFILTVVGLLTVGLVSRGAFIPGVVCGLIGMAIGLIGPAPAVPVYRHSFGWDYFYDGLSIAIVALGLFAVPELIHLFSEKQSVSRTGKIEGRLRDGFAAALRNFGLVVRSSMLGNFLGMLPGLGGSAINWMAYALAGRGRHGRQDSETPLGQGNVRGVIAPEAANNAADGGGLVPTLLFGIPGSGQTAVLLGAFVLIGVQPGPSMVGQHLSLTLTIVWTLALANLIGASICVFLAKPISRLALLRATILFPAIMSIVLMAAYQSGRRWGDILMVVLLGALGLALKNLNWPRGPVLIGFVLALPAERYLHLSMSRYGFEWITRPGVLIILGVVVTIIAVGLIRDRQNSRRALATYEEPDATQA